MNTDAIKRFLTVLSSAVEIERGQLYQLVQSAETRYCWRDIQSQREIGLVLQSFAYPFNQVGKYYESVYLFRSGQFEKARELLESVADSAPARYRSRALLSLSAVEESIGQFEESLRLRMQASSCDDPVTMLEAKWGIAKLSSLEGDHRAALRDLERLMPLAHIVGQSGHPAYFKFLNSYALELSESGRTRDAEQVANFVAASPLISRYREWQETVTEIESRRKRRSFIAVASGHKPKPIRDRRIQAVIKFMKANLHRRVSLDEFAAVAKLSKSHFIHLFKTETGLPPGEYLIGLRIEKARELLAVGSFSVKEVMALVGYGAKTNFAHLFRRYYGFPPSEYRRRALAPRESAE